MLLVIYQVIAGKLYFPFVYLVENVVVLIK